MSLTPTWEEVKGASRPLASMQHFLELQSLSTAVLHLSHWT